jgi:hypothetical protein
MAHFACSLRSCMTSAEVPELVASSASKHRRKLSRSTRISEHSAAKKHDVTQIAHTEIRKYVNTEIEINSPPIANTSCRSGWLYTHALTHSDCPSGTRLGSRLGVGHPPTPSPPHRTPTSPDSTT